jgi:hypothetical protein
VARGVGVAGARGVEVAGGRGVEVAGARGVEVAGGRGVEVAGARGVEVAGARGVEVAGGRGVEVAGARGVGAAGARGVGVRDLRAALTSFDVERSGLAIASENPELSPEGGMDCAQASTTPCISQAIAKAMHSKRTCRTFRNCKVIDVADSLERISDLFHYD